jgi:hypothetical protein
MGAMARQFITLVEGSQIDEKSYKRDWERLPSGGGQKEGGDSAGAERQVDARGQGGLATETHVTLYREPRPAQDRAPMATRNAFVGRQHEIDDVTAAFDEGKPLMASTEARRDTRAQAIVALAMQAGFSRCELSCREPTFDVYELRR